MLKWSRDEVTVLNIGLLVLPVPGMLYFLSSTSLNSDIKKSIFFLFAILYLVLCGYITYKSNQIKWNAKLTAALIIAWIFVIILYFLETRK